jgi:hypothetical protein
MELAIEDALEEDLPNKFTPDIYQKKCAILFEHVFERFGDNPASITGDRPLENRTNRNVSIATN